MTLHGTRVVVTGGAGFIGSELVRQLAGRGARVIVVDNLVNGRRENLDGVLGERVELVVADVRDRSVIFELLRGAEVVFHLACLGVRHSLHSPLENHEVNATATLNSLAAARGAGAGRFVYVSSSEVYGTALRAPMTEEHPTFPTTVYGASKLAGECYARAYYRSYGYPTVVVRPFNTYGPRCHHEGDSGEVIPRFLLRVMAGLPIVVFGSGTQTRDFTYVSDTARGILLAGLADEAVGETINLGSGREVSISTLASEVAAAVGKPEPARILDPPRPGDVARLCAEISKARRLLGVQPQMVFQEGLMRLKDWYLSLSRPPEVLLADEVVRSWEREEGGAR
jgi:UDP-glucose 4-epimerase